LRLMTVKCLKNLELDTLCKDTELDNFLDKVTKTYKQDVEYHNDLHGADVMQHCYYMLTTCGMRKTIGIDKLDCLSLIIAACCHDLGHDGFSNAYHVNAVTSRAIDSNDGAVQETFHAAELFRILAQDSYNFL